VALRAEARAAIDVIAAPGEMIAPFYEGDWGPHPERW
jgi:hypothetical protein